MFDGYAEAFQRGIRKAFSSDSNYKAINAQNIKNNTTKQIIQIISKFG
jgi:hypothetical protein